MSIAILIFTAKVLEEAVIRVGGPPLLGWALAGMLLGPAALKVIKVSPELLLIAGIGVYLFFFIVGVEEVDVGGLISSLNARHVLASFTAMALISAGAYLIGIALELSPVEAVSLAVLASLPTASIVAKTLSDMGLLKSEVGITTFSYALIGEVLGLLVAGALLELGSVEQPSLNIVLVQLGEMTLFFLIASIIGIFVVPRLVRAVGLYMVSRGAQVGIVFSLILLFVELGEQLGVHGVVGALILGLALSEALLEDSAKYVLDTLKRIGNGVFILLFFSTLGLSFEWGPLLQAPMLLAVVLVVLVPYKMAVHYILLKAVGVRHAGEIATSMLARGAVDLAVLAALAEKGFIGVSLYSPIVAVSIASLLGYPVVVKAVFRGTVPREHESPPIMPVIARYILGLVRVRDVMEPPVMLAPQTSVEEAVKVLDMHGAEYGVVADERGQLLGVVEKQSLKGAVGDVVAFTKQPVIVARPEDKLHVILEEMTLLNRRLVPVVDEKRHVKGVVSVQTILRALSSSREPRRGPERSLRETEGYPSRF